MERTLANQRSCVVGYCCVRGVWPAMNKTDEYAQLAGECLQLASRATSAGDKGRLLDMAERWVTLAERVQKTARSIRRDESPPLSPDRDDQAREHAE